GGEITILDPAGYGPVTITKTMSIINDGVGEAGGTTSAGGDAITNTPGASHVVPPRRLNLVGGGGGTNGPTINRPRSGNIQNSVIRGFTKNGINMVINGSGTTNLSVIDTTVSSNLAGVFVAPVGNLTAKAVFKRVQVLGNGGNGGAGLDFYGGSITG